MSIKMYCFIPLKETYSYSKIVPFYEMVVAVFLKELKMKQELLWVQNRMRHLCE